MGKLIGKTFRLIKKDSNNRIKYDIVIKILHPTNKITYYDIKIIHIYSDTVGISQRMVESGLGKKSFICNFITDFVEKEKVEHNLGEYKFIINEPLFEKINKILNL